MKTRTGFVSNSSSSSFIAYGVPVTKEELGSIAKAQLIGIEPAVLVNAVLGCRWAPDIWKTAAQEYVDGKIDNDALVTALTDDDYLYELFDSVVVGDMCGLTQVGGVHSFEEDLNGRDTNFLIGRYEGTDEGEITTMSKAMASLDVDNDTLTALCEIANEVGRDHDLFFGTRYC